MKLTPKSNSVDAELQIAIIEGLKEQLAEQISIAREEFCSKLMLAGLSAQRVKIVESYEMDGDELQYIVKAIYRANGEEVDLSDIQLANEEDYDLWYAGLDKMVKDVVDQYPPKHTYHLAGNSAPVQLYGYALNDDGFVVLTVCVHDPVKGPAVMKGVHPYELTRHQARH
ncbi:MAG: hypothetical protein JKX78_03555 [Alteromonadaceae bacterium]|nr:hypothetical protein [Alteromonadaceae bacterium]MBL4909094.1 hypothetical protein [Alteromonadaceae bacterium]